jgi:hypothetical protein
MQITTLKNSRKNFEVFENIIPMENDIVKNRENLLKILITEKWL